MQGQEAFLHSTPQAQVQDPHPPLAVQALPHPLSHPPQEVCLLRALLPPLAHDLSLFLGPWPAASSQAGTGCCALAPSLKSLATLPLCVTQGWIGRRCVGSSTCTIDLAQAPHHCLPEEA